MESSIVIDHLKKAFDSEKDKRICVSVYLRFSDQEETQPRTESLLATILLQLVLRQQVDRLPQKMVEAYHGIVSRGSPPTLEELKCLINAIAETYQSIFLVIDALDGWSDNLEAGERETFAQIITQLPGNWKILVTSRSGMSIGRQFEASQRIKLEADPADIKLYVESRIKTNEEMRRLVCMSKNTGFQEEVVNTIIKKSQGMYV